MQPHFDVDRAQERDSSPVIFGTYVEARAPRVDGLGREHPTSDVAPVGSVATAQAVGAQVVGAQVVGAQVVGAQVVATQAAQVPSQVAAAHVMGGRRATVTPLPLFAGATDSLVTPNATHSVRTQREAPQRETPQRETLSSSVQLKIGVVEQQSPTALPSSIVVEDENSAQGSAVNETDVAETTQRVSDDSRMAGAWREWLGALARDPEAALAAAQAYQQLDSTGRDEWLDAVDSDLASLGVPAVAVYGPLLAVESDPQRTQRMRQRIARGRSLESPPTVPRRAMLGRLPNGLRIGVLVEPLYLQFVQVLACAYVPAQRFDWVRHDPIALDAQAVSAGQVLEGAVLETVPVRLLVDELARTVVSHRRLGGTLPDALCLFANLFGLEHMVGACDELTWR